MVFLGVGILIISISVVIYRYQSARYLPRGKQIQETGAGSPLRKPRVGNEKEEINPSIPQVLVEDGQHEKEPTSTRSQKEHQFASAPLDPPWKPEIQTRSPQSMLPPPAPSSPTAERKPDSSRMAPPPKPASTFKPPPKPSSALRPPPSAASTLRVPPSRSLALPTSSLAPSTSTLAPSSRPSKKVLLDQGHSPLDWAHLIANPPTPTFLRGADLPMNLIHVSPSALRDHNGRKGKDAWGVWQGKVYNLTPYMKFHPGGVDQLMRGAGKEQEGEKLFNEVHPWVSWENMLRECLVGILVSENEASGKQEDNDGGLDEMD